MYITVYTLERYGAAVAKGGVLSCVPARTPRFIIKLRLGNLMISTRIDPETEGTPNLRVLRVSPL